MGYLFEICIIREGIADVVVITLIVSERNGLNCVKANPNRCIWRYRKAPM